MSFRFSSEPLAGGEFDAFLVPAPLPSGDLLAALRAGGGMVLAYGPPERLRSAFLAGCDDYLRQPWSFEELECRLERAGAPGAQPVQEVAPGISLRGFSLEGPSGKAELSYPESRLLLALLRHRSQALSREVLSYAIWGRRAEPGSRAVDAHVSGLRRKLRRLAPRGFPPIRCLRGVGYCLD